MSEKTDMLKARIRETRHMELMPSIDVPAMLSYYVDEFEKAVREEERQHERFKTWTPLDRAVGLLTQYVAPHLQNVEEFEILLLDVVKAARAQERAKGAA